MVTLRDIAGILGVSVATVSKGLKGFQDVSLSMQEEIRRVADGIGYRSAEEKRNDKKAKIIGIIYERADNREQSEALKNIIDELIKHATSGGYGCLFLSDARAKPCVSYLAQARHNNLAVVCIFQADIHHRNVRNLIKSEIPTLILCGEAFLPVHITYMKHDAGKPAGSILREIETVMELSKHGLPRPRLLYLQNAE